MSNSVYPISIDGYAQIPLIVDKITPIDAVSVNPVRSAIISVETELGINPSGSYSTVRARLDALEAGSSVTPVAIDLQAAYENGNTLILTDAAGNLIITIDDAGAAADFQLTDSGGNYILTDGAANTLELGSNANVVDFVGSAGVTSTGNGLWNFGTGTATINGALTITGTATFNDNAIFNIVTTDNIRLPETTDPANEANTGFIYTKDDGGDTELYYEDDDGNIVKLTQDGEVSSAVLAGFTDLNAAENIATGDALYITTSGTLGIADNATAGKTEVVGFAAAAATIGNPVSLLSAQGIPITVKTDISGSTEGDVVYLSTSGDVTTTMPTTPPIFRVGKVIDAGTIAGDGIIEFSPQSFRYTGSAKWVGTVRQSSMHSMTDYFDDASLDAKWTLWNVDGDHSATETAGLGLEITTVTSAQDNFGGIIQALPADNFIVITAHVAFAGLGRVNTPIVGIVIGEDLITNPGTASHFNFYLNFNITGGGLTCESTTYTNYTTFSAVHFTRFCPTTHSAYLRWYVDRVAATVSPMISQDGLAWIEFVPLAVGGVVSSIDTVGFETLNLNTGGTFYLHSRMFRVDISNNKNLPVGGWV